MEILSDPTPDMLAMPRFDDGAIDMQELLRRLAEQVVNAVVDAEADQLCGGGTNGRKAQRVAEKMGVSRPSKDQVSAIASSLDADIDELCSRPLDGEPVPYVWLDATYVEC